MSATAMCPGCGHTMHAVGLAARYGRTVAVDVPARSIATVRWR